MATAKKSLINLEDLRARISAEEEVESLEGSWEQLVYSLRKPNPQEFFRTHPNPEYSLVNIRVLEDEERKLYLVEPGIVLPGDVGNFVRVVTIVACITPRGGIFLWPIKQSNNEWSSSAKQVAKEARDRWVRMRARMDLNAYTFATAPDTLSAVNPPWPGMDFQEMLNRAFDDRVIQNVSHPLVQQLLGEQI